MVGTPHPQRRAILTGGLPASTAPDSPWSAFARLMEGNKRWGDGTLQHPARDPERRKFVAPKQDPYGVILGPCPPAPR
ncbi:hypothetical protein ABZZ80_04030 [Streptomyces sp. NPDC006356]